MRNQFSISAISVVEKELSESVVKNFSDESIFLSISMLLITDLLMMRDDLSQAEKNRMFESLVLLQYAPSTITCTLSLYYPEETEKYKEEIIDTLGEALDMLTDTLINAVKDYKRQDMEFDVETAAKHNAKLESVLNKVQELSKYIPDFENITDMYNFIGAKIHKRLVLIKNAVKEREEKDLL